MTLSVPRVIALLTAITLANACAPPCADLPPSKWSSFGSFHQIVQECNERILFKFAPEDRPFTDLPLVENTTLRACLAESSVLSTNNSNSAPIRHSKTCGGSQNKTKNKIAVKGRLTGTHDGPDDSPQVSVTSLRHTVASLQTYYNNGKDTQCEESQPDNILFGYDAGALVGVYIGGAFGRHSVASVAQSLVSRIERGSGTWTAEVCDGHGIARGEQVLGVVMNTSGNITAVYEAVMGWRVGRCVERYEMAEELGLEVWEQQVSTVQQDLDGETSSRLRKLWDFGCVIFRPWALRHRSWQY